MTVHYCKQRTPEWDRLRRGCLTASLASKLVTPTGKPSIQYKGEIARIIAERMGLQEPEFIKPTYWMERGINMEKEAMNWFMVETGADVEEVGFVTMDSNPYIGASPDGMIGNIPLELKVPKPSTHIRYLLEGGVPKEYIPQVHFQMVVCGAPYAYFSSYCPEVEPLIVKVEWGDYTEQMVHQIAKYESEYETAWRKICPSSS
jgi:hypothetical protein